MWNEREFWQLFAQTGDPLAYVLYRGVHAQAKQKQEGTACSSIQAPKVS